MSTEQSKGRDPTALLRDALIAAGIDPFDIAVARLEGADPDVIVRHKYEHFTISVAIQCGQDDEGIYFLGNHVDEEGDIYCLNPGFMPDDPAWMAQTVVKYFRNPQYTTSHPLTVFPTEPDGSGAADSQ